MGIVYVQVVLRIMKNNINNLININNNIERINPIVVYKNTVIEKITILKTNKKY